MVTETTAAAGMTRTLTRAQADALASAQQHGSCPTFPLARLCLRYIVLQGAFWYRIAYRLLDQTGAPGGSIYNGTFRDDPGALMLKHTHKVPAGGTANWL